VLHLLHVNACIIINVVVRRKPHCLQIGLSWLHQVCIKKKILSWKLQTKSMIVLIKWVSTHTIHGSFLMHSNRWLHVFLCASGFVCKSPLVGGAPSYLCPLNVDNLVLAWIISCNYLFFLILVKAFHEMFHMPQKQMLRIFNKRLKVTLNKVGFCTFNYSCAIY